MAMSLQLQLSSTNPRQLQYAVRGLREDLKLTQLDLKLLDAIRTMSASAIAVPEQSTQQMQQPNCVRLLCRVLIKFCTLSKLHLVTIGESPVYI
jgi:hypothetical protein